MKRVPEAPPGAKGRASLHDAEPPIHPCARPAARAQIIPFPSRRAALARGLEHLMRALALAPAPDLLVLFAALIVASDLQRRLPGEPSFSMARALVTASVGNDVGTPRA